MGDSKHEQNKARLKRFVDRDSKLIDDDNRAAVIRILKTDWKLFRQISPEIQAELFKDLPATIKPRIAIDHMESERKQEILTALSIDGLQLGNLEEKYKNDKQIVMAAVQQNPHALRFASEKLQADKDVLAKSNGSVPEQLTQMKSSIAAKLDTYQKRFAVMPENFDPLL